MQVLPGDITAILVEDPGWALWREVPVRTGYMLDSAGYPGMDGVEGEIRIERQLPNSWTGAPRMFWNCATQQLLPFG